MRMTKLLALAAVAVVAAACNGTSPTSPGATVASDDATAPVDTKALEPIPPPECMRIARVQMLLFPSLIPEIRVKAVYLTMGPATAKCTVAPVWSSKPWGRLVPTKDPFVVKVTQTRPPTAVLVTAQAPNGVQGSIWVK